MNFVRGYPAPHYYAGANLCGSRAQSRTHLGYAEMEQRRRSQRRLKLTGENHLHDINADHMATLAVLKEPTLYPSAYMVLTNKGYTKHYYAGTERVAARIGGGCLDINSIVTEDNPALRSQASKLFEQSIDRIRRRTLQENDLGCIMNNGFAQPEFNYLILDIPNKLVADVEPACKEIGGMIYRMVRECENKEPDVYFYHSDHLGSASWITDNSGVAVQHIQYLPYGEPFVNQRISGYSERFTFTGKERDKETGYSYFGARYMDHELMTMWLSVDPLADKYPSISPYNYCMWNPIKLVDPDGKDWVVIFDHEKKTVTIEAKYATNSDDAKASAEEAVRPWNDLSGEYSLMVGKDKYAVNFNLSVIGEDEYDLKDKSHNQYSLVSFCVNGNGERDDNIMGQTNTRFVLVRESEKDNYVTSSHEIGHTLGLLHNMGSKGLMEKDGGRMSGHHEITKANVEAILNFALHPEKRDPKYASGKGSYSEVGCSNAKITNPLNLRLIRNKK